MTVPSKRSAAFNTITLGGVKSPGLCKMPNKVERETEVDIQGQAGYIGKIVIPKGEKLVEVTYEFELWLNAHFEQWKVVRQRLEAARVRKPKQEVIVVIDPRLEGITSKFTVIKLSSVSGYQIAGELWGASVTLLESAKIKKLPRLPATQSVQDAFKAEAETLTAEAKTSQESAKAALADLSQATDGLASKLF